MPEGRPGRRHDRDLPDGFEALQRVRAVAGLPAGNARDVETTPPFLEERARGLPRVVRADGAALELKSAAASIGPLEVCEAGDEGRPLDRGLVTRADESGRAGPYPFDRLRLDRHLLDIHARREILRHRCLLTPVATLRESVG